MLKFRRIFTSLLLCILVIHIIDAEYTSEETDEKSKSLFSAVTSILESTDSSKHHHKQTYDSPPCGSGKCPTTSYGVGYGPSGGVVASNSPCYSPTGCPSSRQPSQYENGVGNGYEVASASGSASGSIQTGNTNYGYGVPPQSSASYGGHGHLPYVHQGSAGSYGSSVPVTYQAPPHAYGSTGSYGSVPQPTPYQAPSGPFVSAGYTPPGAAAPYEHWNSHPSHNSYQGPRGYSVFDHSLKTNSEYTEVGSHSGPFQQAPNGNGYGSGYGGYNGLFNKPGF